MSKLQDKIAQARAAYSEALRGLAESRGAYVNDTGKAYAVICAREADLKAKIAQHRDAADAAQMKFKHLFAQANHVVTKEVKGALALKNDALAIGDELANALAESEQHSFEPMVAASHDARNYQVAHTRAFEAYARLEILQALSECEGVMARAMALAKYVPLSSGLEYVIDNVAPARMALVWDELKAIEAEACGTSAITVPEEVGKLNLGPFSQRTFLSPAEVHRERKLRSGANEDTRPVAADALV